MQIIKGSKKEEFTKKDLDTLVANYNEVIVDLGTGDGRFVFKNASENPNNLYIGIDPSEKQLEIYSKETNKKRLTNILFVLGSIELMPSELLGLADYLYINLPWGTLLESVVNPTRESVTTIANLMKPNGTLEITLGYQDETEPGETERLDLPVLDDMLIREVIYPSFGAFGNLELEKYKRMEKLDLKGLDTSWAKKLTFGNDRPLYKIIFKRG